MAYGVMPQTNTVTEADVGLKGSMRREREL